MTMDTARANAQATRQPAWADEAAALRAIYPDQVVATVAGRIVACADEIVDLLEALAGQNLDPRDVTAYILAEPPTLLIL